MNFFLPFETIVELHNHLEATHAGVDATEESLFSALEAFAEARGIDSYTLFLNYQLFGAMKQILREEGIDSIDKFEVIDVDVPLDSTTIN